MLGPAGGGVIGMFGGWSSVHWCCWQRGGARHFQLATRPLTIRHERQLSWPRVGNHSDDWIVGDGWGWTSRLAVQEGLSKDPVMLVWTSFLAAPFGEAIPWPTLMGEPSGLASMARP